MRRVLGVLFLLATVASCAPKGLAPQEGFLEVPGGKIWYRIAGSGTKTPLLLLHGGPGAPSYYLNPLERLATDRPVIFYDQLGAGRSDMPTDTTLWTIDHYVRELGEVRKQLGLTKVHLYGHSWGSILALEYMRTNPEGVKSLVLASPVIDIPRFVHDVSGLLATLPDSTQRVIRENEAAGTTTSDSYMGAMMEFYHRYVAIKPWGPDIDSTFARFGNGVYNYMQGPSEFTITGTLKNYNGTDMLSKLTVPTLFTAGSQDEVLPATTESFQKQVPGSRFALIEDSAHLQMQDQPERYAEVLRAFLNEVEAGKK